MRRAPLKATFAFIGVMAVWWPFQLPAVQAPDATPKPDTERSGQWGNLPNMLLERQFAGPQEDTLIQRWRDPESGEVCYIYLPIAVPYSANGATSFVEYKGSGIGNISCF